MDPRVAGDVLGSGRPTLRRIVVKTEKQRQEQDEDQEQGIRQVEPVTPAGRVFRQPSFNCYILVIFRLKTAINVAAMKTGLENSLIKHKRFSSIMKKNKDGTLIWVPTKVNISDHVIVPLVDGADNNNNSPGFVEKYAADLASAPPLDPCRPLWQIHLLNVESEDGASSAVMKIHHALGDGVSLMSLLLACTRQAGDPDSLPTIPRQSRPPRIGRSNDGIFPWFLGALLSFLLVFWYTLVDVLYFVATLFWIKDSDTPIKGWPGVESSPKQIVYETFSLEDVKFVKKAINGTINDVLLGITSAGIVRYLERKNEEKRAGDSDAEAKQTKNNGKGGLLSNLRVRSTILVNTRPSPGLHEMAEMMETGKKARWGNNLGYMIVNLPMVKHENPLNYVRAAAVLARRKKQSLEAPFTYASGTSLIRLTNDEVAARITYNLVSNTTFSFSNMVGPVQEVEIFCHPIVHILPTVVGHPQALTIHFQSYMGKMTLVVTAATDVIPDPKQLCLDCLDAFHSIKQALQSKP